MQTIQTVMESLGITSHAMRSQATYHPLDPLSAQELQECVNIVRQANDISAAVSGQARLHYKGIGLLEPSKSVLAPYLDEWHAAVESGNTPSRLPRQAHVLVGRKEQGDTQWFDYVVTLQGEDGSPGHVASKQAVPEGQHVALDGEEAVAAEEALLNDPQFKQVIADLQLPENATVVADAWIYGADSSEDCPRFISFMVYMRFIDDADSCHYSAPLPIVPTVLADSLVLHEIAFTPIFGGESIKTVKDLDGPFPWEQYVQNEYAQSVREKAGEVYRRDIKPYHVTQPEGASFSLDGRVIRWQKWSFHIGFNYREGTVISDVRYDGRKTFYRLSLSDMTVPYGDPRAPLHRKQAFDLGGAGSTANELQLGCDCLGEIHYLDFDHVKQDGSPLGLKGTVCIHEQDEGIGWKHTNFRTGNPSVTRSRVLVVQSMITVANYEYIFAWKFDQSANITLETRATGIVSTVAIMPGEKSPYGTIVSPGVLASNHQHLFSVRLDPSIDGHNNTVVQEDSVAMRFDKINPPVNNLYGVGYTVEKTPITHSDWADAAPEKNRVFKIINPSKINPISGRPIGYKLVPEPSQLMLAHPDSIAYQRAEFGDHHIWVTKHADDELYSGGLYTNQSNGKAKGIKSWVARNDNVEDTDLVLWHTFGLTHNPRVEDFPVMPCETHMITLKPCDFFTSSPSNDVPASNQKFNKSKLYSNGSSISAGAHGQGSAQVEEEARANGLGKASDSCCK